MSQNNNKTIKWFDLSSLGYSLKVVPNSPLRGVSLIALEFSDSVANNWPVGKDPVSGLKHSVEDLGFNSDREYFDQGSNAFRIYSDRSEFTLSDLKKVFPELSESHFKEMDLADIVLEPARADNLPEWRSFTEDILSKHAVDVYTPKINQHNKSYREAGTISQLYDAAGDNLNRIYTTLRIEPPVSRRLRDNLERARYRENALITFYPDLESALEAGYKERELEKTDLPYAIPLWVEKDNKIVAFKDVRYGYELMSLPPSKYFNAQHSNGLPELDIVGALRDAKAPREAYARANAIWGDKEASLQECEHALADVLDKERDFVVKRDQFKVEAGIEPMYLEDGKYKSIGLMSDDVIESLQSRALMYSLDSESVENVAVNLNRIKSQLLKEQKSSVDSSMQAISTRRREQKKRKHEDVGEKIGGARKDYYQRYLNVADLSSMNEVEKSALVIKKNIWPPLNYEAMRDHGVTPEAAVAIKYIKDKLLGRPYAYKFEDSSPEEDYIEAVSEVRDALMDAKTIEQVREAVVDLFYKGAEASKDDERDNTFTIWGNRLQQQWGRDVSKLFARSRNERLDSAVERQIINKVREGNEWGFLIKPKKIKSDYEKEAAAEKNRILSELHVPHLKHVDRKGKDWRQGKNVTGDDLMETFGFRAVEYGNWLPQDERQVVLNFAYDSFYDLSEVLEIPPEGVSLGGKLAIAFGARGSGAALAHFEGARNVINLTRMKGAGTLAHEWFHAFDFYLGDHKELASKSKLSSLSSSDTLGHLVKAMKKRQKTEDELYADLEYGVKRGKQAALSWLRTDLKYPKMEAFAENYVKKAHARFQKSFDKLDNDSIRCDITKDLIADFTSTVANISEHGKLTKQTQDKLKANVEYLLYYLAPLSALDLSRDNNVPIPELVNQSGKKNTLFPTGLQTKDTKFYTDAQKFDKTRSGSAYWSTNHEMLARAGAQYVQYALEERDGGKNDYLVYGADEGRIVVDESFGSPNPSHEERLALKPLFETLVEEYREKLQLAKERSLEVSI